MNNKILSKDKIFAGLKLYSNIYKAGSMIKLSNEKHLKLVLKEIGWRIVTLSLLSTKEISRFRMLHNFGVFILKMNRNHGEVYTVKYLKACQLCIQKKLAGQPFSSLREVEPDYNFPRLSKSGLPSVIKTTDRSSICNNSYRIIRLWLSIFSLYRVIKIPFNPKIHTITDSFSGSNIHLADFNIWLEFNSSRILQKFTKLDLKDLKSHRIIPILKSSPGGPKSYSHLLSSYISLKSLPIFEYISMWVDITKSENIKILFRNIEHIFDKFNISKSMNVGAIGKLSFKEEAAGKLRVFAMVDVITQSLLEPLHNSLFALFKLIPNDCTHDQDRGVKYAQELSTKYSCSYGFDLSSATDRLPISSQVAILNSLFGNSIGYIWKEILVSRDYSIEKNKYGIPEQVVRYSVGQPMGALSSWAMLNLMHHMMIQFIAVHLGKVSPGQWYKDYIVLGDDLALFDKDVADRYLLLCKELGVSINLSKSIVSQDRPVLEFAKRTSVGGIDVSALPFKELLTSDNFFGRLAVTTRLIRSKWGKDLFKILTIGNRRKADRTVDRIYPMVGYLTQLFQNGIISLTDVLSLINERDKPLAFFGRNINWMKPNLISRVLRNYLNTGNFDVNLLPERERFFATVNSITFKNVLLHKISDKITKIEKIDYLSNRIEILKTILKQTYGGPDSWKKDGNNDYIIPIKDLIYMSPLIDIFFCKPGKSVPSIKLLNQGLDVDLSLGKGWKFELMTYYLQYITSFRTNPSFSNSKLFVDLKLETLVSHFDRLNNLEMTIEFYKDREDLRKDKIDNPLKVLDFIKEVLNPKFKISSDFVKFDNQYLDSSITRDPAPGFKPRFSFDKARKKLPLNFMEWNKK